MRVANESRTRVGHDPAVRVMLAGLIVLLAAGCGNVSRRHAPNVDVARSRAETVPMPAFAPGTHAGWKGVLNDWFVDGKLDGRHSCRAVRAALRHLPMDGMEYSTVIPALEAYARRVC